MSRLTTGPRHLPHSLLQLRNIDRPLVLDDNTPVPIFIDSLRLVLLELCVFKGEGLAEVKGRGASHNAGTVGVGPGVVVACDMEESGLGGEAGLSVLVDLEGGNWLGVLLKWYWRQGGRGGGGRRRRRAILVNILCCNWVSKAFSPG